MEPGEELYRAVTVAMLSEFVRDSRTEDLYLDFKTLRAGDFSSDDKKNLAKALSGFANADGGVVVWGVDARKNAEGVDCAGALQPVSDVPRVLARLNEFTGAFVSPVPAGVVHRGMIVKGTEGYVVTFVPRSSAGPHMAKGGEDRYYKRSGSSFYKMEHFDLEDMFGRRQRPALELRARVSERGMSGTQYQGIVVLAIANSGRGVARAVYLAVSPQSPYKVNQFGVDGNRGEGLPRLLSNDAAFIRYGAGDDPVIHPGTEFPVCAIYLGIVVDADRLVAKPEPLVIKYEMCADGLSLQSSMLIVSAEELVAGVLPHSLLPPRYAP